MSTIHCLALAILLATNASRSTIEFTTDSLDAVKKNVAEKKAVLVDVRSEEEWKKGHLDDAIFLPVTSLRKGGDAKQIAAALPKNKKTILYTYCVVGMRAKTAAKVLRKYGYTVRPLKPGYEELLEAGFKQGESEHENSRQRNAK